MGKDVAVVKRQSNNNQCDIHLLFLIAENESYLKPEILDLKVQKIKRATIRLTFYAPNTFSKREREN